MKNSAIFRIIAYSVVIVLLLGFLVIGMGFFSFRKLHTADTSSVGSNAAASNNANSSSIRANSIEQIEIEWVDGNIRISETDGEDILYSESKITNTEEPMVVSVNGNCLKIQFSKGAKKLKEFSLGAPSKDLTVHIPKNWNGSMIKIESVSSEITASGLDAKTIEIESVSGEVSLADCSFRDVSLETVSGTIRYIGELDTLNCTGVSAECSIDLVGHPSSISMETVSGDLSISLPDGCGFSAKNDSVSGGFSSGFPTTQNGKTYTYGDGSCKINVSGISGNVSITPSEHHTEHQ